MRFSFFKTRLFSPLYTSLAVLILLLLSQEVMILAVTVFKQKAVDGVVSAFEVKSESERLLGAALEEKVALRGYLLSGDQDFLRQYQESHSKFTNCLDKLFFLVKNRSEMRGKIYEIQDFHEQWELNFAQPILSNSFDLKEIETFSSLDPLREIIDSVLIYEQEILNNQNQWIKKLDQLNQISIGLSSFSFVVLILGSGLNLVLIRRRVVTPLQKLMQAGKAWKQGQLAVQIDHASEDEMGHLSRTLNGMAQEIRLRQGDIQQRNQQLEDLISTLSHDLRTPLLANRSTLDAIARGAFGTISPELGEVLADYCEANDDLIRLVEVLLDVSRYEAKGSQILMQDPLNWPRICQRVRRWIQISSQGKCKLDINIAADLGKANGDGIEIQRVLQNLVDNAVRLSPADSTVSINIMQHSCQAIEVAVTDQGPGLTAQEIKTVFYRFAQGAGRKGRAGLGLYLCRQIIEAHGGHIWIESVLGEGASFRFNLPITATSGEQPTSPIQKLAPGVQNA